MDHLPTYEFQKCVAHSSQLVWVGFDGVDGSQNDSVIGSNAGGLVHRMRVSALDQDIGFGLVAIVRKRLALGASLYQILQILSVTLFEKTPILQALQASDSENDSPDAGNQLILFDF